MAILKDACVLWLEKAIQGKKWVDTSGHGNSGNGIGAIFKESSIFFDGVDDYCDCGNDTTTRITNNLSIECLVRPHDVSLNPHGVNTIAAIIGKWTTTNNKRCYAIGIGYHYAGGVTIAVSSTGLNYDTMAWSAGLQVGKWYHLVYTFASGVDKLYINGVDQGSPNYHVGAHVISIYAGNNALDIGRTENWAGRPAWYQGEVALARVYNKVLSAAQAQEAYEQCYRQV